MDTTAHDLKLLSIGFFIQGGIATFYGLMILCYFGFMGLVFRLVQRAAENAPNGAQVNLPPGLMWIFGAIAVGLAVVTLTTGLCNLYAGVALRRRRHRIFVMVMAVLNCLAAPYGTVLGIFTLLVLQRPAAKELFAGAVVGPVIL